MAKIPRTVPVVMGDNLAANPNISVIGSEAAASLQYSRNLTLLQSLTQYLNGWQGCVVGNQSPNIQDFTAFSFVVTSLLKMISQQGLLEWIATETYYIGAWVNVAGVGYVSKTDNNLNNPVTDTNNWQTLASQILTSGGGLLKARVAFDGFTGAIYGTAFNVGSITKLGVGIYQINFVNPMPDAFYTMTGSAGTPDGATGTGGDNNSISGGSPGRTGVRNVNNMVVWCYESANNIGLEDSGYISVQIS